jgi:hypothetical protein
MNQLWSHFKKFIVRGADSKELIPRGWESAAVGRWVGGGKGWNEEETNLSLRKSQHKRPFQTTYRVLLDTVQFTIFLTPLRITLF